MSNLLVCGTVTYRQQSLERALEGIAKPAFIAIEVSWISAYCDHIYPERMTVGEMDRLGKLVEAWACASPALRGILTWSGR